MKDFNRNLLNFTFSLILLAFGAIALISAPNFVSAQQSNPAIASFTPGNLVIYRTGNGTDALSNLGNPVFLDEFTPSGTLVQSVALPTTVSGANKQLIASGTATSEGLLTRSGDGRYLILTGYARDLNGTGAITGTASTDVNRVIGRVAANGTIDTTTAISDAFSANSIRSAVSTNGTDFWTVGGTSGIRYLTLGSTTTTQINTGANPATQPTNLRQISIFSNQLYVSGASGTAIRLGAVGNGTQTAAGQDITNLAGFATSTGSPYGFFFADLSASVPGVDTVYVTDDSTAAGSTPLTKYSLVGGNWVATGTVGTAADVYRGLTATVSGTTVTLYATRKGGSGSTGGGELVKLVDASGYNGTLTGDPTLLATAAANTAFRGIALAPTAATSPTVKAPVDFNGDGKTDYSITRTQNNVRIWYNLTNGTNNALTYQWGVPGDIAVPADYDGDNKTDLAVWRTGVAGVASFYILNSLTNTVRVEAFGQNSDDPTVVADYDGDGKADLATYRAGTQSFFYYRTTPNGAVTYIPWGTSGDKPVVGDYDGDGKTDVAVARTTTPATFIIRRSLTGTAEFVNWGDASSPIAPGDYDGDGKTDICTTGILNSQRIFYILTRTGAAQAIVFGLPGDYITQGDYDGDGKTDLAVWRNGTFYVRQSSNTATTVFQWGANLDFPVANYNVH